MASRTDPDHTTGILAVAIVHLMRTDRDAEDHPHHKDRTANTMTTEGHAHLEITTAMIMATDNHDITMTHLMTEREGLRLNITTILMPDDLRHQTHHFRRGLPFQRLILIITVSPRPIATKDTHHEECHQAQTTLEYHRLTVQHLSWIPTYHHTQVLIPTHGRHGVSSEKLLKDLLGRLEGDHRCRHVTILVGLPRKDGVVVHLWNTMTCYLMTI